MKLGNGIEPEHAFELFQKSYLAQTGASWPKEKFLNRARNWEFCGDSEGFVAVRVQRSGPLKLVGVAGELRSVIKGIDELKISGKPIWGAVSEKLALMAKKRGFIVPHLITGGPFFIKTLISTIPPNIFGGVVPVVQKDGGLKMDYDDIGTVEKYFIGNREYFLYAVRLPQIAEKIQSVPGLKMVLKLMGLSSGT